MIRSQDVVKINPSQAVTRKWCAKLCAKRNHQEETETSALHSVSYCLLKNASAMIAEREAVRKGIEHLTVLFPTVVSSFDFHETSWRMVRKVRPGHEKVFSTELRNPKGTKKDFVTDRGELMISILKKWQDLKISSLEMMKQN